MGGRNLELGRYRGLRCAGANQAGIGARTRGETEAVEQDRFAGARFAGQDAQARPKLEFEAIDKHDIGNEQAGQHGSLWAHESARSTPYVLILSKNI